MNPALLSARMGPSEAFPTLPPTQASTEDKSKLLNVPVVTVGPRSGEPCKNTSLDMPTQAALSLGPQVPTGVEEASSRGWKLP